jgi:tetratricopeptide (TPR) repeat protein
LVTYFYLGIALFRLGDFNTALSNFIEASKLNQFSQLNYNIALCYIKLDMLDQAVFYLETVTSKEKSFFFAYYHLIKILIKKNNINDAYLYYRDFSEVKKFITPLAYE